MPRYFFHVRDGEEYLDEEGVLLDDLTVARQHSIQIAAQLLGDARSKFWDGQDWQLWVEDESGGRLFTLHFQATERPNSGP